MIGLGTYSFFWQHSERAPHPLGLVEMLEVTRSRGCDLFQICDYAPLASMPQAELRELRHRADDLGIRLEIGTRGIEADHLDSFLRIAEILGASLIRSMLLTPISRPTIQEAESALAAALPAYVGAGVDLALETYEQVPTSELVSLVEHLASPALGICLDPANCVAALEHPRDVVERCAPYVRNIHVKDFAFTRQEGWVGFLLAGAELGTGLLDYGHLRRTVDPTSRGITQIVEHWLPWQGDFESTARLEDHWTERSLTYLKEQS